MQTNRELAHRLTNLENAFDAQSVVSKRRSAAFPLLDSRNNDDVQCSVESREDGKRPSILTHAEPTSGFSFESDLETSRPYRRARRDTMDFSFRSSIAQSNALSLISGLSLSDVSNMSVIALPIYADDIRNAHHYEFNSRQPASSPSATVVSEPEMLPSSFLRRLMEITLQLSQYSGFSDLLAYENLQKPTHPFFTLRSVFRTGNSFLLLSNILGLRLDICGISAGSNNAPIDLVIPKVVEALTPALSLDPEEIFTADDVLGSRNAPFLKVSGDSQFRRSATDIEPDQC